MPLLSKTSTLPWGGTSPSEEKKPSLPKSSTLPLVPSKLVIGRPVLQTATPTASALISKSHSTGVSQSSILAVGKDNVDSSGSGGVACSGVLTKPSRASRGVVFCDPLTLPSPTNPNNPPIIHIQRQVEPPPIVTTPPKPSPPAKSVTSPVSTVSTKPVEAKATKVDVVAAVITPTWTTVPKAVASDIVLSHIDDTDSGSDGATSPKKAVAAPMASPEKALEVSTAVASTTTTACVAGSASSTDKATAKTSLSKLKSKLVKRSQSEKKERKISKDQLSDSGLSSPTSSVKSNEPPVRPERLDRGHLTKLDISGPILQPNFDVKATINLLPVCRSVDATPTETEPTSTTTVAASAVTSTASNSPSQNKKVKASQPPPITPRKHAKSPTSSRATIVTTSTAASASSADTKV